MAVANGTQPSIGGVTSTIWKGSLVLSAKSNPYHHVNPENNMGDFHGAQTWFDGSYDVNALATQVLDMNLIVFDTDDYVEVYEGFVGFIIPDDLAGIYAIGFNVNVGSMSGGYFDVYVTKNGANAILYSSAAGDFQPPSPTYNASCIHTLEAGDAIQLVVFNGTGDLVTVFGASGERPDWYPLFWAYRLGDLPA